MATQTFEATDHKLLAAGEWSEGIEWDEVRSPYDDSVVGRVAIGDEATAERAIEAAHEAFESADFPQYERAAMLERAAELVGERVSDLAATIAAEAGKPIKTATVEAQRCADTLEFSAVEARKLTGGTIPMEASAAGAGKLGVMLRVPYGVVGAISPFNFPLNLVAHKLGPAIAAGNAIVLKPAGQTPISALKLAEILLEAGLPEGWLSVVPGPGSKVGNAIVEHELTKAITFTGSAPVGWDIRSRVPHKKVNLELGSNAPLIVNEDGDWEVAADKAQIHAFSHAGQSCISIQRILLHEAIADDFKARLVANVEKLTVGDPLDPGTDVGPLITPGDRDRVKQWIDEAVAAGAELLTGGELVDEGRCLAPTLLGSPPKEAKVWCEEIFGPVATIDTFSSFDEALAMANDSKFGLQAGVFTRDIGRGLEAAKTLEFGGVLINEVPTFRADQQPYGGVKDSGNTREGPAFAVYELTEERFVTLQGVTEPPDISFQALEELDAGSLAVPVEVESARIESVELGAVEWGSARFEHVHLVGVDLEGSKLRGVSLVDLVGERVNAANGRWGGGTLRRVCFHESRLTGLDFGEARLADVGFEDCKLDYANFRHSEMDKVTFANCAMTEADFQGAKIRATRFDGCDLARADFTKAELEEVDARGSSIALAGSVLGLRGLTIDSLQLMELSPAIAHELGITVEDA